MAATVIAAAEEVLVDLLVTKKVLVVFLYRLGRPRGLCRRLFFEAWLMTALDSRRFVVYLKRLGK